MRRLVWRCGGDDWRTFGITRMHFGDRPAAVGLEVAKAKVADAGQHLDGEAAAMLKKGYVDDGIGGGGSETVNRLIGEETYDATMGKATYTGTVSQIMSLGGFKIKYMIRDGESRPGPAVEYRTRPHQHAPRC